MLKLLQIDNTDHSELDPGWMLKDSLDLITVKMLAFNKIK